MDKLKAKAKYIKDRLENAKTEDVVAALGDRSEKQAISEINKRLQKEATHTGLMSKDKSMRRIGTVDAATYYALKKIDPDLFVDKKKTLEFFKKFPMYKSVNNL